MQIRAKLRHAVIRAHGGVCFYCGGPGKHVDHIVASARGGSDEPPNLIAACINCNSRKGARGLADDVLQAALACAASKLADLEDHAATYQAPIMVAPGLAVMFSESEIEAIDGWRYAHRMPSRVAAIRAMVTIGLEMAQQD